MKEPLTRVTTEGRVCTGCKGFKLWDQFSNCKDSSTGYMSACRPCQGLRWEKWRKVENRDRYLVNMKKRRLAKYGLPPNGRTLLLGKQHHRCALCGRPLSESQSRIEHNHKTNKVRGLVHQYCNTIIGMLETHPKLVRQARVYLQHTP